MKTFTRLHFVLFLFFFAGCATTHPWILSVGQHPHSFEKDLKATVNTNFLLFLPKTYDQEKKKWPLIIFLHGSGERGNDLEKVKVHGLPKIVEQQQDFPFIVVSPQAPTGTGWFPDVLNALLDELIERLPIDQDRIYLTGLSMGGHGTWSFAQEYPDRFAAIAPVCGTGDPDRACVLKNLPVWAFHGAKDEVVPLKTQERMVKALKECGGDVKFTIYPDAGHDSWTETYANPELYKWFLDHRRQHR